MSKNKTMNSKKSKKKKIIVIISVTVLIIALLIFGYLTHMHFEKIELQKKEEYILKIRNSYSEFVNVNKDANLYNEDREIIGKVKKGMYIELELIDENYEEEYFLLKNIDVYIKYTDIEKTEKEETTDRYKNYIPFNKSILTNDVTRLYYSDDIYYILNEEINLPILIDDTNRYYVSFDNKLLYVNKEEATVIDSANSDATIADSIAVLNYHFVVNLEAGEDKLCEPSIICHTDTQFDSHIKYIKENNFYSITMWELEQFIDGKINLPKKSVAITIDDGWFVYRSISILEKYDVMATLFLIGSLAPVGDYASKNLEVHSHTWNLHNVSNCLEGRSPLLCYDYNEIVNDLKQSRESLNNTTYFCYPFYEYNNHAISALKDAGFTMALTGNNTKVTRGVDKFKVPRYVIYNTTTVEWLESIIN